MKVGPVSDHLQAVIRPRACRSFIGMMAVICLSFGSYGLASGLMCSALFPEHRRFLDVNDANTQFYIDGVAVTDIKNTGRQNFHIFRIEEDQKQFIYKLSDLSPVRAAQVLAGIQLGSMYGAPQLYEFGAITYSSKIRNRGPVVYFKLEALFPYQQFLTIKNSGVNSNDPKAFQMIDEISDSFIRMARDGVIASDPDVAYTSDFRWRWIDADLWKRGPPDKIAHQIGEFTKCLNNEMAFYFSKVVLEKAKDVSPELTHEIKKTLSYYLN
jgi:hypothetical protein